jgi:hypothetical protein
MWHVMVDDKDIRLRSHVGEAGVDVTIRLSETEAERMGNELIDCARVLKARTDIEGKAWALLDTAEQQVRSTIKRETEPQFVKGA